MFILMTRKKFENIIMTVAEKAARVGQLDGFNQGFIRGMEHALDQRTLMEKEIELILMKDEEELGI